MSYTLIVMVREESMTDEEYQAYPDNRKLTLFRKAKSIEELEDAMTYWTSKGFSAWIYQCLDDFKGERA